MTSPLGRLALNTVTVALIIGLFAVLTGHEPWSFRSFAMTSEHWQSLKTVAVSIFLEALPFLLLGAFVSSILHLYVSEQTLRRFLPRNPVLGVIYACALGIVLPICECGMIPIVRRLIQKGLPVYVGITYILAAPIINPVTYAATALAFRSDPSMAWQRLTFAFFVAAVIGLLLYVSTRKKPSAYSGTSLLLPDARHEPSNRAFHSSHPTELASHHHAHSADESLHAHGREESHDHSQDSHARKLVRVLTHTADDFFTMGKYLLLGAVATACLQTFVTREELVSLSGGDIGAHAFMMVFAYVISLCSTSDAFIAVSFMSTFPKSSLLAFLVFGPMVDFKNTLMMLAVFRSRFVFQLIALIAAVVFVSSLVLYRTL
ncbi:hypothetical protein FHS18_003197 [Paenibacillus phyllosphaerae]|uniref:Permease n=1 Tax=Paenibacillus phyllosphaerae TaxID=274593 RepID=A0A7W5AZ50_9BACL|nr:permease [Paenibacillus phyllosphaerae]MBB3111129.1 hypothetical protein [Paenibacillus phyllosphaerae]